VTIHCHVRVCAGTLVRNEQTVKEGLGRPDAEALHSRELVRLTAGRISNPGTASQSFHLLMCGSTRYGLSLRPSAEPTQRCWC